MATVNLSPVFNGYQSFLANGLPNALGFINTYQAGTSTPLATYTTSAGSVQNALSIPLSASGVPPNEIWLVQGSAYKFVVTDSLLNVLGTYDNITGINDASYPNLIAYLSALTTTWALTATNAINLTGSGIVSATTTGGAALTPTALAQGTHGYTLTAEQVTTSGTSIDFTGIPSWATKIWVMFKGVSTNGSSPIIIQTGPSGGVENTGYLGASSTIASTPTIASLTTGFGVEDVSSAAYIRHGMSILTLENAANFSWAFNSHVGTSAGTQTLLGAGVKSNASALSRIRITTVGGSDTFDLGAISIAYE